MGVRAVRLIAPRSSGRINKLKREWGESTEIARIVSSADRVDGTLSLTKTLSLEQPLGTRREISEPAVSQEKFQIGWDGDSAAQGAIRAISVNSPHSRSQSVVLCGVVWADKAGPPVASLPSG
jgi:hypothetical protein